MLTEADRARIVAHATRTVLVATRRSTRQHLIREGVLVFSSLGRVRLGNNPACGRLSRRWRATGPADTRPLCVDCARRAVALVPTLANPYLHATPAQVHARLLEVTDPAEFHLLVLAICTRGDLVKHVVLTDPTYRGGRHLTAYVPAARDRCSTSPNRRNLP